MEHMWLTLKNNSNLTNEQLDAFKRYAALLQEWNKKINITAIDDIQEIVQFHFQDSIEATKYIDFHTINMIADVGSGGGFPGLPLKIMFPHLSVVLIEVNHKKLQFLETIVKELGLQNVQLVDLDWRTFLRQKVLPIDLFLARASLSLVELLRIFKSGSPYNHAQLIYWASHYWEPDAITKSYITQKKEYQIGNKRRYYIFFSDHKKVETSYEHKKE